MAKKKDETTEDRRRIAPIALSMLQVEARELAERNNTLITKRLEEGVPPTRRANLTLVVEGSCAGRVMKLVSTLDLMRWPDDRDSLSNEEIAVIKAATAADMVASVLDTTLGPDDEPVTPKPITPKEWMEIG
jgi:hypothetical protein